MTSPSNKKVRRPQPDQNQVRLDLLEYLQGSDEKLFIGIDPGVHGAFGFVAGSRYAVLDIPTVQTKVGKKMRSVYDYQEIWSTLSPFLELAKTDRLFVLLEKAQPNGGGGRRDTPSTAFMVGVGGYMYHLLFTALEVPFDTVQPGKWKKWAGLSNKDKGASRLKAQKLFPKAPLWRVEDHNRAEALLLASYASKMYAD